MISCVQADLPVVEERHQGRWRDDRRSLDRWNAEGELLLRVVERKACAPSPFMNRLALLGERSNIHDDSIQFELAVLHELFGVFVLDELVALRGVVQRAIFGAGALSGAQGGHPEVAGATAVLDRDDLPAQGASAAGEAVALGEAGRCGGID